MLTRYLNRKTRVCDTIIILETGVCQDSDCFLWGPMVTYGREITRWNVQQCNLSSCDCTWGDNEEVVAILENGNYQTMGSVRVLPRESFMLYMFVNYMLCPQHERYISEDVGACRFIVLLGDWGAWCTWNLCRI